MIVKVTREYISGPTKGRVNTNNYNMENWEGAVEWAKNSSEDYSIPFVVLEIHNDYGKKETFEY